MTSAKENLLKAIETNPDPVAQFMIVKTILDHSSPYEELGMCALDICEQFVDTNDTKLPNIFNEDARKEMIENITEFAALFAEKSPRINAEPDDLSDEEDTSQEVTEWVPDYYKNKEDNIEKFIEYCANDMTPIVAVDKAGLHGYDPRPSEYGFKK